MIDCEACPEPGTPAGWTAHYEKPKPIAFQVCAIHAAKGMRGGAVIHAIAPTLEEA